MKKKHEHTINITTGRPHQPPKTLIIACGALAEELLAVIQANHWMHMDVTCLPADWHLAPDKIPEGMRRKIRENRSKYDDIVCLYGDCGTAGRLDEVLEEEGVQRIAGDHCYAFFSGLDAFKNMQEAEAGTFYLTDFLVRHFDRFIIENLGLDTEPDLLPEYFGNFRRVVYLAQISSPDMEQKAKNAAERLGLPLEIHQTGLSEIQRFLVPRTALHSSAR